MSESDQQPSGPGGEQQGQDEKESTEHVKLLRKLVRDVVSAMEDDTDMTTVAILFGEELAAKRQQRQQRKGEGEQQEEEKLVRSLHLDHQKTTSSRGHLGCSSTANVATASAATSSASMELEQNTSSTQDGNIITNGDLVDMTGCSDDEVVIVPQTPLRKRTSMNVREGARKRQCQRNEIGGKALLQPQRKVGTPEQPPLAQAAARPKRGRPRLELTPEELEEKRQLTLAKKREYAKEYNRLMMEGPNREEYRKKRTATEAKSRNNKQTKCSCSGQHCVRCGFRMDDTS